RDVGAAPDASPGEEFGCREVVAAGVVLRRALADAENLGDLDQAEEIVRRHRSGLYGRHRPENRARRGLPSFRRNVTLEGQCFYRGEGGSLARVRETWPTLEVRQRYPWSDWLDGQIWELERGRDFDAKPKTFAQNAHMQAKRR